MILNYIYIMSIGIIYLKFVIYVKIFNVIRLHELTNKYTNILS
jgi:hypothetical protein